MGLISAAIIVFILISIAYFYFRRTVTAGLILTNIVVYIVSLFYFNQILNDLAFAPIYLFKPVYLCTVFTTMFLHGSPMHLIMNMFILFLIGIELERRIGSKKFLTVYILSGIIGSLFWGIINPLLDPRYYLVPAIGASGAIFGILGAFGYLYPNERITMFLGFILLPNVPAILAVTMMGILEVLYAAVGAGNIAHLAHIGGIFGGFAVAWMIKSRTVKKVKFVLQTRNLDELYRLADEDGKEILRRAMDEIPEIKSAWLSEFVSRNVCPLCGERLWEKEGVVFCRNGHRWY